jgi:uncharacterized membrane protein YccC
MSGISSSQSLDHGMLEGSLSRMNTTLFRMPIQWDQALRLILAVALSLSIAYGIGLTGGLVTVIAVLFMPSLPHSPSLAIMRFMSAIVGCGLGWLLAFQFVDQPWLLFMVLMANAYFWFYMMGTGFPFLTMLLLGLMPVLVGWMVYAGRPPELVTIVLGQILCGIFGSEVVCLLWPNTAEKRIMKSAAASLRGFSKQIREAFGVDRPVANRTGKVLWTPSQSVGFNSLLTLARVELGEESKRFKSLAGLVEHVRYLLVWPKVFEIFVRSGHFDKWMLELEPERLQLHDELFKAIEKLALSLENGTPAPDLDALERQFEVLDRRTSDWIKENRSELALENISVIEARCHYAGVVLERLKKIICFTRNEETFEDEEAWDIPKPLLTGIFLKWNPQTGLFAFKALTSVASGFLVASIFPNWGGSLIILLMCGFLAPLTIGGLNVMFVDRMWGLLLAVPVCVLAITQLMPNLVQVGELLVMVGVLLLPGVILALRPKTSSMGLSYAMGILFILTSSKYPSVSLDPVQERFISVGGATLITYIVFRVVVPTNARDLISHRLHDVLLLVSSLMKHNTFTPDENCPRRCEAMRLRHKAVRAGGVFDQLIEDLYWESSPPPKVLQMRQALIQVVNANLAMCAANSVLTSVPLDYPDPQLTERMNASVQSLGDVEARLAEFVFGSNSVDDIHDLMKHADRCILEERSLIIELGLADHIDFENPEHLVNRLVLSEYAHHISMRRIQRTMLRSLQARKILLAQNQPEAVGRTA